MASRPEIAAALKKAAASYFLHKGYSCHLEIGLVRRGSHRADVLAVNLKGNLVIGEVKSSVADFTSDDNVGKWQKYLESCNQFYWLFSTEVAEKLRPHFSRLKQHGCGILVLCPKTGYLKSLQPAKYRPMKGSRKREVITRLAWRSGDLSKRNSRRVRVFLT